MRGGEEDQEPPDLEQIGESGVTEGDVCLLRSSCGNHIAESREGLVDVLRLFQSLASGARLVDSL